MEEKRHIALIKIDLQGCPDEDLKEQLRRFAFRHFHSNGLEPGFFPNEEEIFPDEPNIYHLYIDVGGKTKEELKQIGDEWGDAMKAKAREWTGREDGGTYFAEYKGD